MLLTKLNNLKNMVDYNFAQAVLSKQLKGTLQNFFNLVRYRYWRFMRRSRSIHRARK